MSIALGYFTHNSLTFCQMVLPKSLWAEQIIVLDLGSNDGTEQYCKSILRAGDIYLRRDTNTIPTLGWDEAFNTLINKTDCQWIHASAINVLLDPQDEHALREIINTTTKDILEIDTWHLPTPQSHQDWVKDIDDILNTAPTLVEQHRNIVRVKSGIQYRGYVHEEPYRGYMHAAAFKAETNIRRFHFGGWKDPEEKLGRDAWMLVRAKYLYPNLQRWTNKYWYNEYFNANKEILEQRSLEYGKQFQTCAQSG